MRLLMLGGVRSGKSRLAEETAARMAAADGLPVTYVATARVGDDEEMALRVQRHRLRRPGNWRTIETAGDSGTLPRQLAWLRGEPDVVLLDCLSLWVAEALESPDGFDARLERVASALAALPRVVVVSLEAGLGLLPMEPLGRAFLDRLGDANQAVAAAMDCVALTVAGQPLVLKGGPLP
jgi:adenosylcobinamide kinase/adenosylcobinamide-phosphate guanylyltransferase